ncbi:SDR family NAD(P)-dependent oxidoreductase [Actinacidiphila sp. bgisy167]|uniref:SDR family NAD(P)-dependent oxidoreductase n=1 Tax=Actinacidiphila sp. bgisy167 TaxID=3413797 RepID=UPI003D716DF3
MGEAAAALADWLATPAGGEADLGGLAHTLATRRRGPVAGAVVGRDRVELIRQLRDLARGQTGPAVVAPHRVPEQPAEAPGERPGPVFVFSGYGSQWPGMGQRLLAGDAVFAAAVADLDPVFAAVTGTTLTCLIDDGARTSAVDRTQPLLLGMQLALARTWQAYGITPAAVIGHSMGEVAAAVVTGALDVEDAVRLMVHRARALAAVDEAGGGAMAAVELPDDARAHLLRRHPQVDIAVYASPRRCTVTGPAGPVAALLAELEQAGYAAKALAVTGAGHSAAVDAVLPVLRAHLSGLRPRTPQVPWYSTVDDPAAPVVADLEYWCRNTRRPVCFQQAVTAAAGAGHTLFVEISPHPIAALPVSETLQAVLPGPFVVLPSLRRDGDELLEVRASLAAAHLACGGSGGGLLWPAGPRVIVPSWPWRHSRHWVRSRPAARHRGGHAVLGRRVEVPGTDHVLWHGDVGTGGWNRVERLLHGTPVLSLAAAAHMFLAAAEDALAVTTGDLALHDLELDRLLPLTDSTTVTTRLQPAGPDAADVSIHTQSPSGAWRCHARARVTREPFPARLTRPAPDTEPAVRITQAAPGTAHADPQAPAARLALLDACLHAPTTAPAADTATAPTPAAATAPTTAPAPGRAAVSAGTPAGDIVPAPEPATAGTPAPAPAMALTAATAPAPATVPDVVVPVASSAPGAEPARGAALFPTAVACVHLPTPDPHPHTHTRGGAGIDGVSCQVHLLPADGCCSHAAAGGGQVTAFAEGRPVLHAHGVTLTAPGRGDVPRALRDITYETAWTKAALPAPHDIDPAHWLLLTPMPGSGLEARRFTEPLAEALRAHGGTVTGDGYRPEAIAGLLRSWGQDAGDGPRHVVMLFTGPARPQPADPGHAVRAAADVARHLAAGATDQAPPRLWLVTERALSTTAGEYGDPDRAALAGLVRVLALEQPALRATVVDVDGDPALADDLPRELLAASDADQVVWRAGTRLLARLAPADPHSAPAGKPARFARPDGAYIITGGLGGLGLATARRLAEQGAGRLVLCGRRPATGPASAVIDELRRHGSQVEVVLGDIAAEPTAGMLVAAALSAGHTLAGVAHAAGVLHDRAITELDAADIDLVMAAKATGARHLHQATRGHRPDWWLLFSSAAALTGSPGQAAYAAANAWMDALARNRHADGLPATSIAWGPWAGLGAVPDTARLPMEALQEDQGLDALQLLLAQTRPHLGVLCLDPARIAAAFPGLEAVPYFADLIRDADADTDWPGPAALPALGAAARDVVHQRLMRRAGAVMGYDGDRLDARVPLTDLGLDSLMTVRIQNAVRQDFGIVLPASLALRGATLTDLTDAVVTALGLPGTGTTTPPTPPTPTPAAPAGKTAGAADTGAAHTGTHHTTPALPTVLTPRDAAERLVAGVYQHLTGTAAPGVLQELPHARDPHHAQALADAVNARLHHLGTPLTGPDIAAHPTVAAIADLIRPAVNGTTGSEVRVLKPPTPGHAAPLFVFHPAGGPTTVYRPLVDLLTANRPVYGLDRVAEAATMEDKARHYLRLMRRLWPQGPYHMLGWSFGGCLAYEAACQLHHDGHQPGFLGLIDTILPAALPGLDDRQLLIDRLERFAQYVQTTYGHRIELSHQDLARVPEDEQIDVVLRDIAAAGCQMSPAIIEHQRTSYLDARVGERYRPRPYPGRTVLYRAQDPQPLTTALDPRYLRDQADLGWAQYCPDLQIVPVTGDHLSMIDPPHVTLVADHLDTALAQHP